MKQSIADLIPIEGEAFAFIGRAMQRQIASSLNFTIANLMMVDIRNKMRAIPVEETDAKGVNLDPLLAKYNNTLDRRNEQDTTAEGKDVADDVHEEQGFDVAENPLVLAGRLKVIRDTIALDLDQHASIIPNPLGTRGETYKNPYEVAQSLEESFMAQMKRQPKVNEVTAKAQAEALGLDAEDVIRVLLRQQEQSRKFMEDNKEELLSRLRDLTAYKRPEGMQGDINRRTHEVDDEYTPSWDAVRDLELEIPAIHRARLYTNADRGLYYERDRAIQLVLRGHPDGYGNLKMVNEARLEVQASFDWLMKKASFWKDIDEAVRRGSRWPTMTVFTVKDKESLKAS